MELAFQWSLANSGAIGLETTGVESYFDSDDAFHVQGNVHNQTVGIRDYVYVLVSMYDSADTIIGADFMHVEPDALLPGQQVPFDVKVYFWAGKPDHGKVASYRVMAFDN